jgi:hypothetical protein
MDIVELIPLGKRRRGRWKSGLTSGAVWPEGKTKKLHVVDWGPELTADSGGREEKVRIGGWALLVSIPEAEKKSSMPRPKPIVEAVVPPYCCRPP